jgi:hypothetical protein
MHAHTGDGRFGLDPADLSDIHTDRKTLRLMPMTVRGQRAGDLGTDGGQSPRGGGGAGPEAAARPPWAQGDGDVRTGHEARRGGQCRRRRAERRCRRSAAAPAEG